MPASTNVAVLGAGPYGLSLAAHLRRRGVDFRIFGQPMQSWRQRMPQDMVLKSEGFASDLYDPGRSDTLEKFCAATGRPYADYNSPIPVDTFSDYGLWFQRRRAPDLDPRSVTALEGAPGRFVVTLDDGEKISANRVVLATGISYFEHIPDPLSQLPRDTFSHSSQHSDFSRFRGQDVSVIGGGASALDVVASLRRAGAEVRLVARRSALRWNTPVYRPAWKRWYSISGLGGGWQNRFYENAPMLFRHLPQERRMKIVREWLGPAGAWPIRKLVEDSPLLLGHTLRAAKLNSSRVHLHVTDSLGRDHDILTDHIVAATGFRIDLRRLPFLDEQIRSQLHTIYQIPVLSPDFESSVPGFYFIGLAAAPTFGPVMRFLLGARYTAHRVSRHLGSRAAGR